MSESRPSPEAEHQTREEKAHRAAAALRRLLDEAIDEATVPGFFGAVTLRIEARAGVIGLARVTSEVTKQF